MNKGNMKIISIFGIGLVILSVVVFLWLSSVSKDRNVKAIERIYNQLEMYESIVQQDNKREAFSHYTVVLNKIDISDCPDDFQEAFQKLTRSCEELNVYLQDKPVGILEGVAFSCVHLVRGDLDKRREELDMVGKELTQQFQESVAKMNSVASQYGIVFDKDSSVIYSTLGKN